MIRHLLAPNVPRSAAAIGVQRTLPGAAGVAITFDDGPHPEGTPAVLELLAEADIKATFFLVGEQVERRPALAARIADSGHVVALHGYRHRPQPMMPRKVVREDMARAADVVQGATGVELSWHRPPYGLYSPGGLDETRSRGLRPLLWSRWGKDWRRFTTPERIATRASANVRPGDVILLHDADFYSSRGS
ncbi:MAG TPA: polysaccharide deacetylase family protein, partial [Solirubrobacteraceae bacterium]|nr:polysaccharide deacetylase family protein [Solirubrobacteraceae bacterium]